MFKTRASPLYVLAAGVAAAQHDAFGRRRPTQDQGQLRHQHLIKWLDAAGLMVYEPQPLKVRL